MAQRQRVDALAQQIRQAVFATGLASRIVKASGNRTRQAQPSVDRRQQRNAAIAGDVAATEISLDFAAFDGWKLQRDGVTFCHGGLSL